MKKSDVSHKSIKGDGNCLFHSIVKYLDLDRIKNFNFKDSSILRKNSFQHICTLVNWHNKNNFDKF